MSGPGWEERGLKVKNYCCVFAGMRGRKVVVGVRSYGSGIIGLNHIVF